MLIQKKKSEHASSNEFTLFSSLDDGHNLYAEKQKDLSDFDEEFKKHFLTYLRLDIR